MFGFYSTPKLFINKTQITTGRRCSMRHDFTDFVLRYTLDAQYPAELFKAEIKLRTGNTPRAEGNGAAVELAIDTSLGCDSYKITLNESTLKISAACERALIYGIGTFLKKTVYGENAQITLIEDINGIYTPNKRIRGHQLGYRNINNTYDAWGREQYFRYMLDTVLMGANICEFIPLETQTNNIMPRSPKETLITCCEDAHKLGLNVSFWLPNDDLPIDESASKRREIFKSVPALDVVFIPGSDPGEFAPKELFERVEKIAAAARAEHPDVEIWVSAQAPHDSPTWGDKFIAEMEKEPSFVDGIILGPNRAMNLDELRRRLPAKYPIRFYNDITHNVRCEHPVHFENDDWHFSLAAVNGRESINPRPFEYARLHKLVNPFVVGSCSYSEGVNDDVNKAVWAALDFCPEMSVKEILLDYSRLFFYEADAERIADAIILLEENWQTDCAANDVIDKTYAALMQLAKDYPHLNNNWRFNCLLLRAECDLLARKRRIFELELIEKARALLTASLKYALCVLETDFDESYIALRADIDRVASLLFEQIGLQLDVKRFHASSWERGAMLESVDLPVTDRPWLVYMAKQAISMPEEEGSAFLSACFARNDVQNGEAYFSTTLHGKAGLNLPQKNEVYLNFRGDSPDNNNGSKPVCMLSFFDSYTLDAEFSALHADTDYTLSITYKDAPSREVEHHRITVNNTVLYDGEGYGGSKVDKIAGVPLPDGFDAREYDIPKELVASGKAVIEIAEATSGFEVCELRLTKK